MLDKALLVAPVGAKDGSMDDDMKLCTKVVIQYAVSERDCETMTLVDKIISISWAFIDLLVVD